jgi:hypothetical protein
MRTVLVLIMLCLFSCKNTDYNENNIYKVELLYYFDQATPNMGVGAVNDMSFIFHRLDYNNPKDSGYYELRSIYITIPETDTIFSLKTDSIHEFVYQHRDSKGRIIGDKIDSGEISGVLIEKDLWEIKVKTKCFDFKKLISTKRNKYPYYENFLLKNNYPR